MRSPISVVIPVYNGSGVIDQALDSAWNQSLPPQQVFVCDDGSEDREDLERVLAPWRDRSRVMLVETRGRLGPAAARNLAMAHCETPLVALLDADDLYERERLRAAVRVFAEQEDVALTYSDAHITRAGKHDASTYHTGMDIPEFLPFDALLAWNPICTVTVTVRTDLVEQLGGFDERPRLIGVEDYHLWLRLATLGRLRYIPYPLATYAMHDAGLSANPHRRYEGLDAILESMSEFVPDFEERHQAAITQRRRRMLFDLVYDLHKSSRNMEALGAAWEAFRQHPLTRSHQRLLISALAWNLTPTRWQARHAVGNRTSNDSRRSTGEQGSS